MKKIISILIFVINVIFLLNANENSELLKVNKYILDNGLTVYLNEDHTASKVYGAVVVKAGSKNDPENCSGMAHFLEHMLFKGTTELGTIDYEKEKLYLDEICDLYDKLHKIKTGDDNALEREQIYKKINELSIEASKYEVPNDYASLIQSIGGAGLNANTHYDRTIFHSAFPSSQTEKWIELYSEVLSNPVFRLYQVENEVIKEEKNNAQNSHPNHFQSEFRKYYFKIHPYGKVDTLGNVDDICYIPVSKMKEFYNTYYVANNMALILTGDFNAEKIMPLIKNSFSKLGSGLVPKFKEYKEKEFKGREVIVKNVYGPDRGVIAFRTVNNSSTDIIKFLIIKNLLLNSNKTGPLNKLEIDNQVNDFSISFWSGIEESGFFIYYWPKPYKLTPKKIEDAVIENLNKLKKGDFTEEALKASKYNVKLSIIESFEALEDRADNIIDSYLNNIEWEDYIKLINSIADITKEDIVKIANLYFNGNYFVFSSHSDWDTSRIKKAASFPIKEIPSGNNYSTSVYTKKFKSIPGENKKPKFMDYTKDIEIKQLKDNCRLYYTKNPINNKFEMKIYFLHGLYESPDIELATTYLSRIAPKDMKPGDFKHKMESIGCNYSFRVNDQLTIINLYGAEENLEKGMELLNELIMNPEPDEKILKDYVKEILDHRRNWEKDYIPTRAMIEYMLFNKESQYLKRSANSKLNKLTPDDLFKELKNSMSYKAGITYSGKTDITKISDLILKKFIFIGDLKEVKSLANRPMREEKTDKLYFYNSYNKNLGYLYFYVPGENFNINELSNANAFHEYFCGKMSSVLFHEIRELRSLSYSVWGEYHTSMNNDNDKGYLYGYISFKMDKLNDVIEALMDILKNMTQNPDKLNSIRETLINQVYLCNSDFREKPFKVFNYELYGINRDLNEILYDKYQNLNFDEVMNFYIKNIQNRKISILFVGSADFINYERLGKLGSIYELRKEELYKNF